jgi:uncharacterized membrane protein YgdD (TMEM256/DUF423 family)
MVRAFFVGGSLAGGLAVGLGAFGAHALRAHFQANPDLHSNYLTAVNYQFVHGLALLAVASAQDRWPSPTLHWAGYSFILGILVFSGSLYALSLTGTRVWGAITPIGGVAFLLGWALLALTAWRI